MLYVLRELKIEVTQRCSLNCVHCSSDATPTASIEIDDTECRRILSEAAALGASKVAFSGGEPLLYAHLDGCVLHARKRGLEVIVYTSGNVDDVEVRLRSLADMMVSKVVFSVFGADEQTHERVTRVPGSYAMTCAAATFARQVGLATEFHFVPMSTNYRELADVARIVQQLGASALSVLRFVPQGRGFLLRGRVLTRAQNSELVRTIRAIRESGFTVRTGSPYNFLFLNDPAECNSGKDRLVVGPTLRAAPCDAFKQITSEELTGSSTLSSLQGVRLSDFWRDSPYLAAVRQYLSTPFAEPCGDCRVLRQCHSGCLAQKVVANGTLEKARDPDCVMG